ncbi:MAG: cytochrome c, partial [Pyrinomonadaceae bacterium]|nr:cytochrome c [Phycisphaerales bacterium]
MPNILTQTFTSSICQRVVLLSGLALGATLLAASGLVMGVASEETNEFGTAETGTGFSVEHPSRQPAQADELVGWYARYRPSKAGVDKEVKTHAPYAAMALEPGQSVHPSIPADSLEAIYTCDINIESAGKYRFGAEVEGGSLQIAVLGGKMAEPMTLKFGPTPPAGRYTNWIDLSAGTVTLQYTFQRNGPVKTRLRAMWEKQGFGSAGFRPEPIPVSSSRVPEKAADAVNAAIGVDRGRVLLSELGCVHCHSVGEKPHTHDGKTVLDPFSPVLHRAAPLLEEVGTRASAQWITNWVTDPSSIKRHAKMPAVFTGADAAKFADSITHFLVSLSPGHTVESVATEPLGLALAQKTYQTLGCVACHGEKPGVEDAPVPLTGLAGKWNPSELSAFLLDPRKARPEGRMPSLNLTRQEADLLATHLVSSWGEAKAPAAPFVVDQNKVQMGKMVFAMKCASCHTLSDGKGGVIQSTSKARSLMDLGSGGCLNANAGGSAPRYDLVESDRAALTSAITAIKKWATGAGAGKAGVLAAAPMDKAHLTIDALSCRNCHVVHGSGGLAPAIDKFFTTLGEADMGEEGRVPPRLNGTGTKLTTSWMHDVFEHAGRARPYMGARMPQFGEENVGMLPEALAQ